MGNFESCNSKNGAAKGKSVLYTRKRLQGYKRQEISPKTYVKVGASCQMRRYNSAHSLVLFIPGSFESMSSVKSVNAFADKDRRLKAEREGIDKSKS